jgi:hypothetical protein
MVIPAEVMVVAPPPMLDNITDVGTDLQAQTEKGVLCLSGK